MIKGALLFLEVEKSYPFFECMSRMSTVCPMVFFFWHYVSLV
jgi:hypothetical protein